MKDTTKHSASSSSEAKAGAGKIPRKKQPTSKKDIVISIKKQHMDLIVSRDKNHEFRKYLIAPSVERMWLYVSSPDQTLRYVAVISKGKLPGSIKNEDGVGNAEFDAGKKESTHAYEIKELFQLRDPLPLARMKRDHGTSFPQRYTFANKSLVDAFVLEDQIKLF